MTIVLRTVKGAPLTITEIDGNFSQLTDRLTALEQNPPLAESIGAISVQGDQLSILGNRGSNFGQFALPVAQLVARGVWATATAYAKLEMVNAPDGNGYICLTAHTSGVFATDLAANRWAKLVNAGTAGVTGKVLTGAGLTGGGDLSVDRTLSLASMPANSLKGNNGASTAVPSDLTAAQAAAMLPAMLGDSGSGGAKGLVPAPAAGDAAAGKFLKANGTWAVPAGGGGGGSVGGSSGQLQYNSAGVFAGATNLKVIGSGAGLNFGGVALQPAASAGSLNLYANNELGQAFLSLRSDTAPEAFVQECLGHRSVAIILPSSGGLVASFGVNTSNAGSITHSSSAAIGYWIANATTATANNDVYFATAANYFYRNLGFYHAATLNYPDASYGAGATGTRIGVGLVANAASNLLAGDTLLTAGCGFQYSTNRGDSNWQLVSFDGTTQTTVNTGMVFAPAKLYQFELFAAPNGGSLNWRIKNLTDNSMQSGVVTTNLPPASTGLMMMAGVRNLGASIRNMQMKRMYGTSSI
jgi:hypothetical protein